MPPQHICVVSICNCQEICGRTRPQKRVVALVPENTSLQQHLDSARAVPSDFTETLSIPGLEWNYSLTMRPSRNCVAYCNSVGGWLVARLFLDARLVFSMRTLLTRLCTFAWRHQRHHTWPLAAPCPERGLRMVGALKSNPMAAREQH